MRKNKGIKAPQSISMNGLFDLIKTDYGRTWAEYRAIDYPELFIRFDDDIKNRKFINAKNKDITDKYNVIMNGNVAELKAVAEMFNEKY